VDDIGMPFPNLEGKHAGRSVITARRLLEYRAQQGETPAATPPVVVLAWSPGLEKQVRERRQHREARTPGLPLIVLSSGLGFALLPIGAPMAAIIVEELAPLGTAAFIGIGAAGGIGDGLAPGDLVVCSSALRDEGTSHHYAPPERFALPDAALTARLRARLPAAAYGPTWTIDAPYQETAEEIACYQDEGILTVEMEAAALFTVARLRGVAAASAFCVSDVLHGEQWEPHFGAADVRQALWTLFEAAEGCQAAGSAEAFPHVDPFEASLPAPVVLDVSDP
jgi:uridine phosphorylase